MQATMIESGGKPCQGNGKTEYRRFLAPLRVPSRLCVKLIFHAKPQTKTQMRQKARTAIAQTRRLR
jgi:hypothetical protein